MLKLPRGTKWAGLVAVAVLAGLVAYFASRDLLAPEIPPPEPPGSAVVPDRRPDITLADRDGQRRSLSEWDGKALIINFWASWCAPCRREIPMLNSLAHEYGDRGFDVIGIAVDFRDEVLRFVETTPIDYAVLIGEQDGMDAARAFGMETIGLPFTVFTDRSGRIAAIHVGELQRSQAEIILSAVQDVDAGNIAIGTARDRIRADLAQLGKAGTESR